jgi:hypothetical protein
MDGYEELEYIGNTDSLSSPTADTNSQFLRMESEVESAAARDGDRELKRLTANKIRPKSHAKNDSESPLFDSNSRRSKSSLRLRYEAEVSVIKRKLGDLETIRNLLGLSQRKMCQLLFVDPSAWTRWAKHGEEPPPHVYRMLTWYLALNDKYPAMDVNFWIHTVARAQSGAFEAFQDENQTRQIRELSDDVVELRLELAKLKTTRDSKTAVKGLGWLMIASLSFNLILFLGIALVILFR